METKERPILFNAQMVRAILEGRKTQTRRVIKPQPVLSHGVWVYDNRCFFDDMAMQSHLFHDVYGKSGSPYGSIYGDGSADRLWVRESFWAWGHFEDTGELTPTGEPARQLVWNEDLDSLTYVVDYSPSPPPQKEPDGQNDWHKRPSIFMPRWASRLVLYLVDVRIERVQDINAEDCEAEGLAKDGHAFRDLWDSINAKRGYSWESNPWVWVVEFQQMF